MLTKFTPSGCGVMCFQDFENIRTHLRSGLTKHTVNPNDKQDVAEALTIMSEKACRVLYSQTSNITTAVYSFLSKTLYDIINLNLDELPLKRKVFLCGMIERILLGWQVWVQLHPKYKLSANFFSAQYSKFFCFSNTRFYKQHPYS